MTNENETKPVAEMLIDRIINDPDCRSMLEVAAGQRRASKAFAEEVRLATTFNRPKKAKVKKGGPGGKAIPSPKPVEPLPTVEGGKDWKHIH